MRLSDGWLAVDETRPVRLAYQRPVEVGSPANPNPVTAWRTTGRTVRAVARPARSDMVYAYSCTRQTEVVPERLGPKWKANWEPCSSERKCGFPFTHATSLLTFN